MIEAPTCVDDWETIFKIILQIIFSPYQVNNYVHNMEIHTSYLA